MKKQLSLLFSFILFAFQNTYAQDERMYAHFINVGQASAALLEFPCGAVLIDAGSQDDETTEHLVDYLTRFFDDRPDLNRTLDLVIITHCHGDHNEVLDEIHNNFTIKRYIDNGVRNGSGRHIQKKFQDSADAWDIKYGTYTFEDIIKKGDQKGLTNAMIDPIKCETVDPKIILYSGAFINQYEGWTDTDYGNGNNHSLFIKVIYGKASFLFTGDGEIPELNTVTDYYSVTNALDADILLVSHHGADDATTDRYLEAVTPKYAVISCGNNKEKKKAYPLNAYHHGHPKKVTIEMLERSIPGNRTEEIDVRVGLGKKKFENILVRKRIYATTWDKDIVIRASKDGTYRANYTK